MSLIEHQLTVADLEKYPDDDGSITSMAFKNIGLSIRRINRSCCIDAPNLMKWHLNPQTDCEVKNLF